MDKQKLRCFLGRHSWKYFYLRGADYDDPSIGRRSCRHCGRVEEYGDWIKIEWYRGLWRKVK